MCTRFRLHCNPVAGKATGSGGGGGGGLFFPAPPLTQKFLTWQGEPALPNSKVIGTDFVLIGLAANRPAAGLPGRLYFNTDTGNLFRDNGVSWDTYTAAGFVASGALIFGAPGGLAYSSLNIAANKQVLRSNGTAPVWSPNVVLTDADATQTIQGTGDSVEFRIAPHTDGQGGAQLNCVNAAGTITWFAVGGNGKVRIGKGLQADSGGGHARSNSVVIAISGQNTMTCTWGTAFPDTNYSVAYAIVNEGGPIPDTHAITGKFPGNCVITATNKSTTTQSTNHAEAIAFHD